MSVHRIASRYAKSLIELAIDQNKLEAVTEDVKQFKQLVLKTVGFLQWRRIRDKAFDQQDRLLAKRFDLFVGQRFNFAVCDCSSHASSGNLNVHEASFQRC